VGDATLILLRHGESVWNGLNLFTGWVDVDLTEKGKAEAVRSGELIKELDRGGRPGRQVGAGQCDNGKTLGNGYRTPAIGCVTCPVSAARCWDDVHRMRTIFA
jgi:hypothetical protein